MDHLLFENLTDTDKAKQVLAVEFANAARHNVTPDECVINCFNKLSDIDKLDVNRRITALGAIDSYYCSYPLHTCIKTLLPFIIIGVIGLIIYCCL